MSNNFTYSVYLFYSQYKTIINEIYQNTIIQPLKNIGILLAFNGTNTRQMILKSIIFTLIIFSFLNKESAFAQKQWNLEECIQYALENNLDIETQTIITRVDKEQLNQAKRSRLPYIGASSGYSVNFGKSVDPNTNNLTYNSFASNSYSLNSSVTLFDGFIKNNQIAYNRFVYLAALASESPFF